MQKKGHVLDKRDEEWKRYAFEVMEKINATTCKMPVALGDVLVENICDDVNLIVAGNF